MIDASSQHQWAFLDNCAQRNFITLQPMHLLDSNQQAPDSEIGVKERNAMSSHGRINLTLIPKFRNNIKVSCGVRKHHGSQASKYTNVAKELRNFGSCKLSTSLLKLIYCLDNPSIHTVVNEPQGRNHTVN